MIRIERVKKITEGKLTDAQIRTKCPSFYGLVCSIMSNECKSYTGCKEY